MSAAPRTRSFGQHDLDQFYTALAELRVEQAPPQSPGHYVAYTDGACLGNPEGPGGWAAVVEPGAAEAALKPWLLSGHLSSTSNNRAEALGVLGAMEWVPSASKLEIHSDSELTVRILQGRYRARANPDIWDILKRTATSKQLELTAEWVRGHAGDPRNELADRLSKLGATRRALADLDRLEDLAAPARPNPDMPAELVGLTAAGEWERTFLKSVADQLRRRRPLSAKQQAIVDKIRQRGAPSG